MLGILRKMFNRRRAVLPLEVDVPQAWTDGDSVALAGFMQSGTGVKLKQSLAYECYDRMTRRGPIKDYDKGMVDGFNAAVATIMVRAQLPEPDEDEDRK